MKIYTINEIKDKEYELLDTVQGNTVQTRNALRDVVASLRNIVGGEMVEYTEMLEKARVIATEKMIEEAKKLDTDAIINVRFTTSSVMDGCTEVLAYGTAIKYK